MAERFAERAATMGLDISRADKGLYKYSDRYGEVVYRSVITEEEPNDENVHLIHPTDGVDIPLIAIFTKAPEWEDYQYVGCVSQLYKFIGNDVVNQRIRESITSVGMPIMTENTIMNSYHTRMRNEIFIQSSQQVSQVGDIVPVMIVQNSYDGTKAASLSFGLSTMYGTNRLVFSFSLGEIRQVHIVSSNTSMSSAISSYMQVFSQNITDMITQSFSNQLTESDMLGVLDVIEGYGKKRRDAVSNILTEMQAESGGTLPTAWQMFLAIIRYSSFETNLNIKKLLENAAESVLVIPERMMNVLQRLG
jgi:hypothetical protein